MRHQCPADRDTRPRPRARQAVATLERMLVLCVAAPADGPEVCGSGYLLHHSPMLCCDMVYNVLNQLYATSQGEPENVFDAAFGDPDAEVRSPRPAALCAQITPYSRSRVSV
jgi:hypothetical protein